MQSKTAQINIAVSRDLTKSILEVIRNLDVPRVSVSSGRRIILGERKGVARIFGAKTIIEDPIQTIRFMVPLEKEEAVLSYLTETGQLYIPGRGSVYGRKIEIVESHELCKESTIGEIPGSLRNLQDNLVGITCIVQKDYGNAVGRVALDTGTSVPSIIYGEGTGLRDKLGLWRVTIPAEKELITIVVTNNEAKEIMDMMIDRGSLDKPGMGFIFMYPLGRGCLNTRLSVGNSEQAATMEQIISAIDDIKGTVEWRRRELMDGNQSNRQRKYLADLVNLTLVCDEGRSGDLITAAMAVGAAGATISKTGSVTFAGKESSSISPAREVGEMIVSATQVQPIREALMKCGAFDDNTHGLLYSSPVTMACTYLGQPKN